MDLTKCPFCDQPWTRTDHQSTCTACNAEYYGASDPLVTLTLDNCTVMWDIEVQMCCVGSVHEHVHGDCSLLDWIPFDINAVKIALTFG